MEKEGRLCFSRRPQEAFTIFTPEGEIKIAIVESSYSRVRISVKAPQQYTILRDELINKNGNEK